MESASSALLRRAPPSRCPPSRAARLSRSTPSPTSERLLPRRHDVRPTPSRAFDMTKENETTEKAAEREPAEAPPSPAPPAEAQAARPRKIVRRSASTREHPAFTPAAQGADSAPEASEGSGAPDAPAGEASQSSAEAERSEERRVGKG